MAALLVLLLSCSAAVFLPRKETYGSRVLEQLSDEERHYLSVFLRIALFPENFAYVLFGSKPMAFTSCEKSTPSFSFSSDCLSYSDFEEKKGLEVFKKLQPLFSSQNFFVKIIEHDDCLVLLIFNKNNLLNTLQQHVDDFKQVLGTGHTVESLFHRMTQGDEYLSDVINKHEALLGILLGYGRNNSWLFHQKHTITTKLNQCTPPKKRSSSLEQELERIVQNTDSLHKNSRERKYILRNPFVIPLPGFMADSHSLETYQLKEMYEKDRQQMQRLFVQQDFVEATINRLME